MYRTPTTSTTSAAVTSPTSPPAVQDAAKTFIRRPERKRRSLDNMEAYKKKQDNYAITPSDKLLLELMKTFEDIPTKVHDYPQMRRDIKTFLEVQSDRGQRILYELSNRMTSLEAKTRLPTEVTSPGKQDHILERLGRVEENIEMRIHDLEAKMTAALEEQTLHRGDGGDGVTGGIVEKIDEVRAAVSHATEGVRVIGRTQITLDEKLDGIAGNVAAVKVAVNEVAEGMTTCEQRPMARSYASVAAFKQVHRPALHSIAVTLEGGLETADEVLARVKKAVDARLTGLTCKG